jgi:hypothetical protein
MKYLVIGVAILAAVCASAGLAQQQGTTGKPPPTTSPPPATTPPLTPAGPENSSCQTYAYADGTSAINCPTMYTAVSGPQPHTVGGNEWGTVLIASGGGTVAFTLPSVGGSPGRNGVGFTTDGNTGFTVIAQSPAILRGSAAIRNGTITALPNASGWIDYVGNNIYQVYMYMVP